MLETNNNLFCCQAYDIIIKVKVMRGVKWIIMKASLQNQNL